MQDKEIAELERIIEEDYKHIAKLVNDRFEEKRGELKEDIFSFLREHLTPLPPHYEWVRGDCPYDSSGELRKDGYVSLDQTVYEFLENEYTGYSEATYTSGCGLYWCKWGDFLAEETLNFAWQLMQDVVAEYLSSKRGRSITNDDTSQVDLYCVYDNCYAWNFFCCEPAIEFVGIGDMPLSEIIQEQ